MACRDCVLILAKPGRCGDCAALVEQASFQAVVASATSDALRSLRDLGPQALAAVICSLGTSREDSCWPLLAELRSGSFSQVFVIVLSHTAARDVRMRLDCFDAGARMVTSSLRDVGAALARVASVLRGAGPFECPMCALGGLSEAALHLHMHMHHAVDPNMQGRCPVCKSYPSNLAVHVHNKHGPSEEREPPPAPFAVFAWCVCRRPSDGKFLLVNEPAGISRGRPGYWLPAGRLDAGETLVEACSREALEEAGVAVRVTALLRLMVDGSGTIRAAFLAAPEDDGNCEPKSIPDWESVGAMWADIAELGKLSDEDYRSPDPADLYPKVASGSLEPQSLDTDAFRELEALMRRLTSGDEAAKCELPGVWRRIQATYPKSVFQR